MRLKVLEVERVKNANINMDKHFLWQATIKITEAEKSKHIKIGRNFAKRQLVKSNISYL